MPSASSEPSIITEVKPERMARHADRRALAVVLVHDDGQVRVGFERGEDLVAQEGLAGVFAGAGRGLHDDRGVDLAGGFADGPDLFHVVDVEGGQAIAVFGGMVEQLAHGYEGHDGLRGGFGKRLGGNFDKLQV